MFEGLPDGSHVRNYAQLKEAQTEGATFHFNLICVLSTYCVPNAVLCLGNGELSDQSLTSSDGAGPGSLREVPRQRPAWRQSRGSLPLTQFGPLRAEPFSTNVFLLY